jgi:aldehyde dehydrogenase (NAD+)
MNWAAKAWYRIFQFFFYKAAKLLPWRKPMLLEGPGSVLKLPETIKKAGAFPVLVVTDRALLDLHLPDKLLGALEKEGVPYAVFADVKANPTIDIVEQARQAYLDNKCKGFIAFGGGSSIDTAKAAAARIARPRATVAKMGGFLKVMKRIPPIFAVPTTAGTGSEVTIAAVVTDGKTHHKYAINDPQLIPVCAVLDAELTAGLPKQITADTGMDALTHAVEAYITHGVSKLCRDLSEKAVKLIYGNLEKAYKNGADLEARQNMLLASFYAGDSFTRAGLTYVHPIAHTLGGLYNVPHGRANAVILPYVLDAFGASVQKKLAKLAAIAGLDVSGKTEAEAAGDFIASIRRMNMDMGIPEQFGCIRQQDVPQMVKWALAEANPWYPVPKIFGAKEIERIIQEVIAKPAYATKEEIVAAQRGYFESGVTLGLKFRLDALKSLRAAVIANERKLMDALHADLGKSNFEGYMTEIGLCRDEVHFLIEHLPRWIKARHVPTPLAHFASNSFVASEPYGVALILSPWNYPVLLSLDPLAGAIAAGNCAILKPSKDSPATSQALSDILGSIFPPEFVSVVQGGRAENADLLEQKFDYIFFTGSVAVGKAVMEAASKHLTPVSLELGGKSPVIIDDTADLKLTAKRLAFGKYINAGQTCVAPDYVYVHESKKDELIKELGHAISGLYPNGVEDSSLPRIVNEKHFDRLLGLMAGEKAAVGGNSDRSALKIAPTVLDGVTQESPVMSQEIFGPILPLLTYADIEDALRAIRSRPKPLALYLFSRDKALQKRILREVPFGGGCINDTIIHLATPHMGFGGVGESGTGAYHGKLSFDTFTHYKSIVDKKNWIDLPIRYAPFTKGKEKLLRMVLK